MVWKGKKLLCVCVGGVVIGHTDLLMPACQEVPSVIYSQQGMLLPKSLRLPLPGLSATKG